MLYQHNYFAVSVKLNFCQRQTHCIDYEDKVQSATDTDNEFTECQKPRENLQRIAISPVSLHAFMKTLKRNIPEAYKVQSDCLKDSESDLQDKNGMKEKVNNLVRLHKAMQEKLKQHHIKNKCKLLPWLLIYGLECTVQNILMLLNTLLEPHMKQDYISKSLATCKSL